LADRTNGSPCTCLNYATKANSQLRFAAPKGQVCRQDRSQTSTAASGAEEVAGLVASGRLTVEDAKAMHNPRNPKATVDAPKKKQATMSLCRLLT
jgi:hypothetical protein